MANKSAVDVSKQADICMIAPTVRYESIGTEKALPASYYSGEEVNRSLQGHTREILQQKGFRVAMEAIHVPSSVTEKQLDVFRPVVPESVMEALRTMDGSSSANVLFLDLRVKVGEGGTWNPISGAITAKNHYCILRAVMIGISEKKVLWHNEVQLREIPRAGAVNFTKAMQALFQTLQ